MSKQSWREYFDRKINEKGTRIDRAMWGRPRIQDVRGNWFTRSGKACCGCGKHKNMDEVDPFGIPIMNVGGETPKVPDEK